MKKMDFFLLALLADGLQITLDGKAVDSLTLNVDDTVQLGIMMPDQSTASIGAAEKNDDDGGGV